MMATERVGNMAQDCVQVETPKNLPVIDLEETRTKKHADVMSAFIPIGVLGAATHYNMPSGVLNAVGHYLGGTFVKDMPPFLVPCTDGMALVLTIRRADDYMGGAVFLAATDMAQLDYGIHEVWEQSPKEQTVREFFGDTAFTLANSGACIPEEVASSWRCAFC
jgi:hypothetical protein